MPTDDQIARKLAEISKDRDPDRVLFQVDEIEELEAKLAKSEAQCEELAALANEFRTTFNLRWKADRRATERWRSQDPEHRSLTIPDHADLCVWLLEQLTARDPSIAPPAILIDDEWLHVSPPVSFRESGTVTDGLRMKWPWWLHVEPTNDYYNLPTEDHRFYLALSDDADDVAYGDGWYDAEEDGITLEAANAAAWRLHHAIFARMNVCSICGDRSCEGTHVCTCQKYPHKPWCGHG